MFIPYLLGIFLSLFLMGSKAWAENLEISARYQVIHIENILRRIDLSLIGLEHFFAQEKSKQANDLIIHDSLNRRVARLPGLLSLIITDGEGNLRHDSFKYPAQKQDLSDKPYIVKSKQLQDDELHIGALIENPFTKFMNIPLTKAILAPDGRYLGSVTAIMTPDQLFEREVFCKFCYGALYKKNGESLISYPAHVAKRPALKEIIDHYPSGKTFSYPFNGLGLQVVWFEIPDYQLIFVLYRA